MSVVKHCVGALKMIEYLTMLSPRTVLIALVVDLVLLALVFWGLR